VEKFASTAMFVTRNRNTLIFSGKTLEYQITTFVELIGEIIVSKTKTVIK
jgi:hypothetical protein